MTPTEQQTTISLTMKNPITAVSTVVLPTTDDYYQTSNLKPQKQSTMTITEDQTITSAVKDQKSTSAVEDPLSYRRQTLLIASKFSLVEQWIL